MTTAPQLDVLIAGGGLSGLALAQALHRDGVAVEVIERDADFNSKQGYYLNINGQGGEALRRCLPPDLFELYAETSRRTSERAESIVLTSQLVELSSQPHVGPPNDGPRPHTGVHRRTLRQILAARLDDVLTLGVSVVSFEQDDDGVTVTLSDGSTRRTALLVGADGIRSAVRGQLMPDVPVIPTGIRGIGVYGRTPLSPELESQMPAIMHEGVIIAVDPGSGARLLLAEFRPRQAFADATATIAPDVELDPVPDYLMISCSTDPGTVVPPLAEWTADTPAVMRDSMLRATEGWHPALRAIVAGVDLDSLFMIPFGYIEPRESWTPSRVTLMGDAAHGMLPTLGMGANLSLLDAELLADRLAQVRDGERGLVDAVGAYEEEMRAAAYPILRMTLEHDKHFGGGALQSTP